MTPRSIFSDFGDEKKKKSKLFCAAFVFFYIDPHDSGLLKSHLPPPKHVWGGLQGWSKGHILADFQGIISTLKKN